MFMLNVCVNVMCVSDVCTFFDCQVPISNSAMRGDCKWNLRRRNRSIWGWERNEDVVMTQSGFLCFISMGPAKSSIFNISIHPHSYSMSYMNMDISKQKRLKLPIQCFNLMFSIWQPFHPTSTNLSSVTNEHGLWFRPSCPQGHNLFGY